MLLCTNSGPAEIGKVARRIHQTFTAPFTCTPPQTQNETQTQTQTRARTGPGGLAPVRVALFASLGVAVTSETASSAAALLHQADTETSARAGIRTEC